MSALSWNEIKERAIAFSNEWSREESENAEAKSFLDAFFYVFGILRRRVATFEQKVRKADGKDGYIDMLYKRVILVEMKSRNKSLDKAYEQAKDYFPGLKDNELPRYIMVCNFARIRLYDLDGRRQWEFELKDLYKRIRLFGFLAGYETKDYRENNPVNIEAAEKMAVIHDKLKQFGYSGHALEVYLVRLVFCMFADSTTIFDKGIFRDYIEVKTKEDGTDLDIHLRALFEVLDTSKSERMKNISEDFKYFRYVNGKLFRERLPMASFDSEMRRLLLECCDMNWGMISPAIFGSLFQSIMNPIERRSLGAHYTSEQNIMKVINPLFMDGMRAEFDLAKGNEKKLKTLHKKIASLKFLDPACGCGNFLVIAYRELRLLELDILRELQCSKSNRGYTQLAIDVLLVSQVDVDQFYGIELEEFPAQIAQVALWLVDHQMNMMLSDEFGEYYVRLPLKKHAKIVCADALKIGWEDIIKQEELSYIIGNPPFVGKKEQSKEQKDEVGEVFSGLRGNNILDYVSCWYARAAEYIQGTTIKVAFVSTNSITQGEQVGLLWKYLAQKYRININFAYRTFKWSNEGRGVAAVHCVIIGFSMEEIKEKYIYDYDKHEEKVICCKANTINPYLVDAPTVYIDKRGKPLCNVPEMSYGSIAIDNGKLILSNEEYIEILRSQTKLLKYIRPLIGGEELINGDKRWCIWLLGAQPEEILKYKFLRERVEAVKIFREKSNREATRKLAGYPSLFGEIRQPDSPYIAIPKVSSEQRKYVPISIISPEHIASGSCLIIPTEDKYIFGVLSSSMHMAWMRTVCGRMKSDYQYSASIVYNNFPWPDPTGKQHSAIEIAAKDVLDVRSIYANSTLSTLYSPTGMPPELVKAHKRLDAAVDKAYGKIFISEPERVAFLMGKYSELIQNI